MPDTETLKPKHWFVPENLWDTPYDEANQNNWAWPEARMKRNARAQYRAQLVTTYGILLAAMAVTAGTMIQALV